MAVLLKLIIHRNDGCHPPVVCVRNLELQWYSQIFLHTTGVCEILRCFATEVWNPAVES